MNPRPANSTPSRSPAIAGRRGRVLVLGALLMTVVRSWSEELTPARAPAAAGAPPPVVVTLRLDQTRLAPGGTTLLRAFAQVANDYRSVADQIFSWNLDLLTLEPAVASLVPGSLTRSASDRDPVLGSGGVVDGPHLRGIRDSFLKLPGAGMAQPVELFAVTISALTSGTALFRVRPPTLGEGQDPDFLVLPLDDRDPWSGGDYAGAVATLTVSGDNGGVPPTVRILPGGEGRVRIETEVAAGSTIALEEAEGLESGMVWRRVAVSTPGSLLVVFETQPVFQRRFYRAVRL